MNKDIKTPLNNYTFNYAKVRSTVAEIKRQVLRDKTMIACAHVAPAVAHLVKLSPSPNIVNAVQRAKWMSPLKTYWHHVQV